MGSNVENLAKFMELGIFCRTIFCVLHQTEHNDIEKPVVFSILKCFSTILSGGKGKKDVKFLVLIEEKCTNGFESKICKNLAKAQCIDNQFIIE